MGHMRYEYGQFVIDSSTTTILIDNKQVKCDDRIIHLMQLLAQNYPEHCDTQYLLATLWPKRVVSISSLTRLVSDSRALFRAQGVEQPIIQTLHGRGYRLAHETANLCRLINQPGQAPVQQPKKNSRRMLFVGTVATLAAILTSGVIHLALSSSGTIKTDVATLKIGEPESTTARILWVDDHPENNTEELAYLRKQNIAVYQAVSSEDALTLLAMYQYKVILTDMGRQGDALAGLRLTQQVRQNGISTPIIIYTIMPSAAQKQIALEHGANAVAVDRTTLYQLLNNIIRPDIP